MSGHDEQAVPAMPRWVVDSQVHLVPPNTAERPWRSSAETFHGWRELGTARMLREMDAAGVARAVVVPTSAVDGLRNDFALAAAQAHPDRFSVVGLVDMKDAAAGRELISRWRTVPGLVGLRAIFRHGVGDTANWLSDGTADWFWPAAEAAGIPLYVHAPGQVRRIDPIARDHPRLRMVIDHLGMSADVKPQEIVASIRDVASLARYDNVCAKASALSCIAPSKIAMRELKQQLRPLFAEFGPNRVFWGSDFTRLGGTYRDAIDMFLESTSFLRGHEIAAVMGTGVAAWLGLPAGAAQSV